MVREWAGNLTVLRRWAISSRRTCLPTDQRMPRRASTSFALAKVPVSVLDWTTSKTSIVAGTYPFSSVTPKLPAKVAEPTEPVAHTGHFRFRQLHVQRPVGILHEGWVSRGALPLPTRSLLATDKIPEFVMLFEAKRVV